MSTCDTGFDSLKTDPTLIMLMTSKYGLQGLNHLVGAIEAAVAMLILYNSGCVLCYVSASH